MKYFTAISFLSWLLFLGVSSIYACDCAPPSLRRAYRDSNAVFLGQVVEIEEQTLIPSKLRGVVFSGVKFKVEKAWKGVRGQEIMILSDMGFLTCIRSTDKFRVGGRYLIYAYGKELTDYGCSRSVPLEEASEDIKRLNSGWFRLFARMYPFPKI